MSKLTIARRLAEATGVSLAKATRYVDEVGVTTARRSLDEVAEAGSRTVSNWWKPTAAVGVVGGGGALAWRQQDLQTARAIADQEQSAAGALAAIMDSDLPPDAKRELAQSYVEGRPGEDGEDGEGAGLLPDDLQTTIILLIVLVFALKFGMEAALR